MLMPLAFELQSLGPSGVSEELFALGILEAINNFHCQPDGTHAGP
jgi:hypothetical protein